jgi:hypothetical protein
MERYFLHLKKAGVGILEDEEGSDLPDLQAARDEALRAARDIVADAIKAGSDLNTEAVIVANGQGRELDRVPLTAVLPKSLQQCRS